MLCLPGETRTELSSDPHCFADYEACGLQSRPLQHCMLRPDKHYSCEISASTASTLATLHLTTSQPGCPARHLGAAPCRGSLVAGSLQRLSCCAYLEKHARNFHVGLSTSLPLAAPATAFRVRSLCEFHNTAQCRAIRKVTSFHAERSMSSVDDAWGPAMWMRETLP